MSSTTLKELLERFLEEHHLGRVGATTAVGDSTSLIDATRFTGGSGNEWPQRSPIRITSGARIGESSYKDDLDPTTGDLTLGQALTGAPGSGAAFVIASTDVVDHIDRFIEALNRGIGRWCKRWMAMLLTYCPGGDFRGASSTADGWAGTNATLAYADMAHPTGHNERVLQVTATSADGYAANSAAVRARAGDVWRFHGFMRPVTDGATAQILFRDLTAGADIALTFSSGQATCSEQGGYEFEGTFTVPAGCERIEPRMISVANGTVAEFGPLALAPEGVMEYTARTQMDFAKYAGRFQTREPSSGLNGFEQGRFRPVSIGLRGIEQYGWGLGCKFDREPPFPLYVDELSTYAELSSDTGTTPCPKDLALAAMAVEFFGWADRRARRAFGDAAEGTRWADDLAEAKEKLDEAVEAWGPEQRFNARREYSGRAIY